MVVAFYFRLHLAYFPRPVVAIFARPEHRNMGQIIQLNYTLIIIFFIAESYQANLFSTRQCLN